MFKNLFSKYDTKKDDEEYDDEEISVLDDIFLDEETRDKDSTRVNYSFRVEAPLLKEVHFFKSADDSCRFYFDGVINVSKKLTHEEILAYIREETVSQITI